MSEMEILDHPLTGTNLIEASAGTGKTYTLAGLYLRLIVEQGFGVEQILVVTYTKAATAELRERIRQRLVEAQLAFEQGEADAGDIVTTGLLARVEDRSQALRRLKLAVLDFDRAAIFTIHGFCQRVLQNFTFESGESARRELVADDEDLLQQVVDDFWRCHLQDAGAWLVEFLLEKKVTPDSLLKDIRDALNKPYLEIRGATGKVPALDKATSVYQKAFADVKEAWAESGEAVETWLMESDSLHRNKYRKTSIPKWIEELKSMLDGKGWSDYFERFTTAKVDDALKTASDNCPYPFFERCDRLDEAHEKLQSAQNQGLMALKQSLIAYANETLSRRKTQARITTFDDLLLDLYRALTGPGGDALAAVIRQRMGAALIDEFQDTDPLQYEIFRLIYFTSPGPVYLVGDPKQAIYSFRGADIFAYLRAKEDVESQFNLSTNWRSIPALLDVVNELFSKAAPFLFDQIDYRQVVAAGRERQQLTHEGEIFPAFNISFLPGGSKALSKDAALSQAADSAAVAIADLLKSGTTMIGDQPVVGRDIAVLVKSHIQGSAIKQALKRLGINSVQRARENIFQTPEAEAVERVLKAVAEPGRESGVKAALLTDLFGLRGEDIEQINSDERSLERYVDNFQNDHHCWQTLGFIRMFRQLLVREKVSNRLLSLEEGERRLTNLLHLGELLHQVARDSHLGMEELIRFLSHRRQQIPRDEIYQLRLESDRDLVQIVTIHSSKGLQYPVVFCPFVWDGYRQKPLQREPIRYHDDLQSSKAVFDLGSADVERGRLLAKREALAEELRLLYVALTRAEHHCHIIWGNVSGIEFSAMGWLLHADQENAKEATHTAVLKKVGDDLLTGRLEQLVQQVPGKIHLTLTHSGKERFSDHPLAEETPPELRARRLRRSLWVKSRVTSFSALVDFHGTSGFAGERGDGIADARIDQPEHDREAGPIRQEMMSRLDDIFHFPRGAQAGSCLHAIFERISFNSSDDSALKAEVERQLELFGFDLSWTPVIIAMVSQVLTATLDSTTDIQLVRVPDNRRLVEMGFYYPLAGVKGTVLSRLLKDSGFCDTPQLEQALKQLHFPMLEGFLKGFIDLIFEVEGRYYVVDYKSNWLGNRQIDYSPDRLADAVAREGYFLQYLLYTLALHRYLKQRLSDYEYERHIGGVYYLFLRGISVDKGDEFGIFKDRPSVSLIEALDRYFELGEVDL
ncbi:MAG: exodeoxyribonuclease V subunit beta [Gammaproteobacteria bacterium]|nr:exodeoxyribonuclease V subunit beta [Gammaproteobacteria bacterium]